jgi:hypothetical protein
MRESAIGSVNVEIVSEIRDGFLWESNTNCSFVGIQFLAFLKDGSQSPVFSSWNELSIKFGMRIHVIFCDTNLAWDKFGLTTTRMTQMHVSDSDQSVDAQVVEVRSLMPALDNRAGQLRRQLTVPQWRSFLRSGDRSMDERGRQRANQRVQEIVRLNDIGVISLLRDYRSIDEPVFAD